MNSENVHKQHPKYHVAIDIGAGSGRLFAGYLEDGKLKLDELHRFHSEDLCLKDQHVRNIYRWHEHVLEGLKHFVQRYGDRLESMGVDSFGSDFVFLDGQGNVCKMPIAYRYSQPSAQAVELLNSFGPERMYAICGNHTMKNDTVLQIIEEGLKPNSVLPHVRGILFFGDIFQYFLCGNACNELSMASYSKMVNQQTWQWEDSIFRFFNIDDSLKMPIVRSGDRLGKVYPDICKFVGLGNQPEVVTPAIHDTADAAFVVPDLRKGSYFNSSGSWSLVGTIVDRPILSADAWAFNASNSNMPIDQYMFKKNVAGMWIMQCCRATWEKYSYAEIATAAEAVTDNRYYIDPDAERFFNPECMPEEISRDLYERYGVTIDADDMPRIARVAFESLAMKYHYTLDRLGQLSGIPAERLYIVGGGSQNALLNQLAANACGLSVFAGIPEASVAGNILCQMYGLGEIGGTEDAHEIIRNSFTFEEYKPQDAATWKEKYAAYLRDALHEN